MSSNRLIKAALVVPALCIVACANADGPVTLLSVTSPAGGEIWPAGSTFTLAWTSHDPAGFADILLERAGQPLAAIGYARMSDDQADWEICPVIGDAADYRIRLVGRDRLGTPVEAVSQPFTITGSAPHPVITITQPAGGEAWAAGSTQTIQWTATNPNGNVYVDLHMAGEFVRTIAYLPISAGQTTSRLCAALPSREDYTVRVFMDACGESIEAQSMPFAITNPVRPTLTLARPVGGEAWSAGTTERIEWTSTDAPGDLSIDLLKNGRWYAHVANAPVSMGFFDWTICPTLGDADDYQIRIASTDLCGEVVESISGPLSVSGSLPASAPLVIRPAAGEAWRPGTTHEIQWSAEGATGSAIVGLLTAEGWHSMLGITDVSDETLNWTIPADLPLYPFGVERFQVSVLVRQCGRVGADVSGRFGAGEEAWVPADLDWDGDVDVRDFAWLQACFSGTDQAPVRQYCVDADLNSDGQVDLTDFELFQACSLGPAVPPPLDCLPASP